MALGSKPVEYGGMLYLALEDNHRRLQKRLKKRLVGDIAPDGLNIATDWPRMDEGGATALGEWLEAVPETRLAVDILKRVRPRTSPNRSLYESDYEAPEAIQRLAGEYGIGKRERGRR